VLGVAAAVAEFGLLRLLVEELGVVLPLATIAAAETLILVKFVLADRWVFGHRRPTLRRAIRYHGACAGALVVYWLVINGAAALGLVYTIGFVVGTAASFLWSLLTNFLWVWSAPKLAHRQRQKPEGDDQEAPLQHQQFGDGHQAQQTDEAVQAVRVAAEDQQ
jgi:putative flippase GtrA